MMRDRPDALRALHLRALCRTPLFQGLDAGAVATLASRISSQRHVRGDVMATPEDLRTTVVIVLEGMARLCRFSDAGQPLAVDTLNAGACCGLLFGDLGLQPRSYLIAMAESVAIGRLPVADVRALLASHPPLALHALGLATERLLAAYDRIEDLGLHPAHARLAHLLARLAAADGRHVVDLLREEIASLIGTSREEVSRGLSYLRTRDLIEYHPHRREILVKDLGCLAAL